MYVHYCLRSTDIEKKGGGNLRAYLVTGKRSQESMGRVESMAHLVGRCDKVEAKLPGALSVTTSS